MTETCDRRFRSGLVLGKFMPPHAGHLHLVDFASRFVDELAIVVEKIEGEPIPSELRVGWMRELAPRARVLHLEDLNPQSPAETNEFWSIWQQSLERLLPYRPDVVFASESYGARLAEVLGATFVPVDPPRSAVRISATAIRERPFDHWQHLPPCVRAHYVRRVVVFGPESTGKSTLARRLAEHYDTVHVPEFARTWLESRGGEVSFDDMEIIARGQAASEAALARQANRMLFLDTDVLTTTIWSEILFGRCAAAVHERADAARYDLTLLLDVDVPWVGDPVRYLPNERRSFFDRCRRALEDHGRRHVIVRGDFDERFRAACAATESLIDDS